VDCSVAFWQSEIQVKEEVAFQLTVNVLESVHISNLPFTSLSISFSEGFSPVMIHHSEAIARGSSIRRVDLGAIPPTGRSKEFDTNLRWHPEDILVFSGLMSSEIPGTLEVICTAIRISRSNSDNDYS
jgi:trafficking protein particle complex subunit 11